MCIVIYVINVCNNCKQYDTGKVIISNILYITLRVCDKNIKLNNILIIIKLESFIKYKHILLYIFI